MARAALSESIDPDLPGHDWGAAIDVGHLATQTMNDPLVERQVLALFRNEAASALVAIAEAGSMAARCAAAHKLSGAARAIGAWRLAAAAAEIEAEGKLTEEGVGQLSAALIAVTDFIANRLTA